MWKFCIYEKRNRKNKKIGVEKETKKLKIEEETKQNKTGRPRTYDRRPLGVLTPFCRSEWQIGDSIQNLFFDCIVAKKTWETIAEFFTLLYVALFKILLPFGNKKHSLELLSFYLLLSCGAYDFCEMNLSPRVEGGEAWSASWLQQVLWFESRKCCIGAQATLLLECLRLLIITVGSFFDHL